MPTLNEEFSKNPFKFFNTYPVLPPGQAEQALVNVKTLLNSKQLEGKTDTGKLTTLENTTPKSGQTIQYIDFIKSNTLGEPNAVTFSAKKSRARKDSIAVHFLPWKSMNVVSMKIPAVGKHEQLDMLNDKNPGIFFTAAVTGCSVFVKGGPKEPEIHHGGIMGKLRTEPIAFWQNAMKLVYDKQSPKLYEVNKSNYIKDAKFEDGNTTKMAKDYENWLKKKHKNKLTINFTQPWGSIFGIRYGHLWSFYYQENVTVQTTRFVKANELVDIKAQRLKLKSDSKAFVTRQEIKKTRSKWLIFSEEYVDQVLYIANQGVTRNMAVHDFFPGGKKGSVTLKSKFESVEF